MPSEEQTYTLKMSLGSFIRRPTPIKEERSRKSFNNILKLFHINFFIKNFFLYIEISLNRKYCYKTTFSNFHIPEINNIVIYIETLAEVVKSHNSYLLKHHCTTIVERIVFCFLVIREKG